MWNERRGAAGDFLLKRETFKRGKRKERDTVGGWVGCGMKMDEKLMDGWMDAID